MIKINLKYWRKRRVLTIVELSKLSTVSTQTIVSIERGDNRDFSPKTLRKLASALRIEVTELVTDESFAKTA